MLRSVYRLCKFVDSIKNQGQYTKTREKREKGGISRGGEKKPVE